jgi:long-chain acyl-CoA synthetase
MVVGEGKNRASALIQPCFEQAKIWLDEQGVSCEDNPESLCKNELLFEKINNEIRLHDHKFGKWEQVKEIRLTPEIWSIEAGHLTPTMKVKRKIVQEKYQSLVDEIYS